jgi:2,3,4,5-tetrahydropyridine-2-carboxylate N-succinyltransferase
MKGFVPARSVVIPGSYTKKFPAGDFQVPCAIIIGNTYIYRFENILNNALREYDVAV